LECSSCRYRISSEDEARKAENIVWYYFRRRQKKHREFLKSSRWHRVAKKILEYDDFTCQICGHKADSLSNGKNLHHELTVHHIVLNSADEDLTPKNLVTLCTGCHNLLHGPNQGDIVRTASVARESHSVAKPLQSISGIGRVDVDGLRTFYHMVKKASEKNRKRFKMPLENIMLQLCFICPRINECGFGKIMLLWINYGYLEQYDSYAKKLLPIGQINSETRYRLDVEGYVIEKSGKMEVDTKYGRTELAKAVLRDDTGEISLNLWGTQIQIVKIGDFIRVEDAYVKVYDGKTALNIRKKGKITILSRSKP